MIGTLASDACEKKSHARVAGLKGTDLVEKHEQYGSWGDVAQHKMPDREEPQPVALADQFALLLIRLPEPASVDGDQQASQGKHVGGYNHVVEVEECFAEEGGKAGPAVEGKRAGDAEDEGRAGQRECSAEARPAPAVYEVGDRDFEHGD